MTTISFLLDRTGSMNSIKSDVIGGFNAFLQEQRKERNEYKFVLTLFDSDSIDEQVFDGVADVPELTQESYVPRAATPLLDAIAKTIRATEAHARRGDDRVLFVVYTDGEENASVEYKKDDVRRLVEEKQGKNWEFVFLGAGIDAYHEAAKIGIPSTHTFSMGGSGHVHRHSMAGVSLATSGYAHADSNFLDSLTETEREQAASNATTGS